MTHYEIDYSKFDDDQDAKRVAAIADIIDYLGKEKYETVTREFKLFKPEDMSRDRMAMMLSIAGISGYPVTAWHETCFPPVATVKKVRFHFNTLRSARSVRSHLRNRSVLAAIDGKVLTVYVPAKNDMDQMVTLVRELSGVSDLFYEIIS